MRRGLLTALHTIQGTGTLHMGIYEAQDLHMQEVR